MRANEATKQTLTMTQSEGGKLLSIHLLHERKVHVKKAKTENHKDVGGKFSVWEGTVPLKAFDWNKRCSYDSRPGEVKDD